MSALALLTPACARPQWTGPLLTYPEPRPRGPVTLPMRDPLVGPALEVLAELQARPPSTAVVREWMLVDSGSTVAMITESSAAELGLEPFASTKALTATRGLVDTYATRIPQLRLGQLVLN